MEYVITCDRPFDEIEALTIDALERRGLGVNRTFSLRSAISWGRMDSKDVGSSPGYSVLMLFEIDDRKRPLGLLTLYERGGRTVIKPVLSPEDNRQARLHDAEQVSDVGADTHAELVAALMLSGLRFCMTTAEDEDCIDLERVADEFVPSGRQAQDPVCGKWIERARSAAGIEYKGEQYYLCCPLCRDEFGRRPEYYAQAR
jgi:YHS domain-containing protein